MSLKNWLKFIGLGLVWGSSFLWIKLALRELGPFTLVSLRVGFALLASLVVLAILRPHSPWRRFIWVFLFMGVFNSAVPFVLISWAEQHISSGLAAILNSTVPLFTILIAPLFLRDDPFTLPKAAGLVMGFSGVILLMSDQLGGTSGSLWGFAAMLLAAVSYASAAVFARRQTRGIPPEVQTLGQMGASVLVIFPAALIVEAPFTLPELPLTWTAVGWLGILGTCLATLIFYSLLHDIGPTRTVLVTYMFPLVGVILGIIFLKEALTWRLAAGGILIISSIVIVNSRAAKVDKPAVQEARAEDSRR